MTDFATTFGELVVPDLRRLCRVQGLFLALGLASFSEASDEVMEAAARRGATRLKSRELSELEDWVTTTILKAETEFAPSVAARRAIADRVARDIAEWEERCR